MNISQAKDALIDAQQEIFTLRTDVKRLQERYEFHKYAVSQWLIYEKDTHEELDKLHAENNMLKNTDEAVKFFGYEERLSEAQAELAGIRNDYAELADEDEDLGRINDELVAENGKLRAELEQYKRNIAAMRTTLDAIGGEGWRDE